jgi:hypothetical protein
MYGENLLQRATAEMYGNARFFPIKGKFQGNEGSL